VVRDEAGREMSNETSAVNAAAPKREVYVPAWVTWPSWLLSIAGLGVSIYLTIEHYDTKLVLSCPNTGKINCVKVTTSVYSKLFGIPVALLGLLFFVGMVGLCAPFVWRWLWTKWIRIAAVSIGIVFVARLVWAELFRINAICLWCTSVHVITLILFILVLIGSTFITVLDPLPEDE
jgi:uncharacterized membrane protein